jgi:hypothetical protein
MEISGDHPAGRSGKRRRARPASVPSLTKLAQTDPDGYVGVAFTALEDIAAKPK